MTKPDRNERLAKQLRDNLKKRKQQERARDALVDEKKPDPTAPVEHSKENQPSDDRSLDED